LVACDKVGRCSLRVMDNFISKHGLVGSLHLNHRQRSLGALLNFDRSKTPRLPSFFGLWILFQLTSQWPPLASSLSCHRKFLLILSIFFMPHLKRGKDGHIYDIAPHMRGLSSPELVYLIYSVMSSLSISVACLQLCLLVLAHLLS
jgi:hypothetical protein